MDLLCFLVALLIVVLVLIGAIVTRLVDAQRDIQTTMWQCFRSMDAELARIAEGVTDTIPARLEQFEIPKTVDPMGLEIPPGVVLKGETSRCAMQRLLREAGDRARAAKAE